MGVASNITQDPAMPKATDGKTVVEVAGQANREIQQYILANTRDGAACRWVQTRSSDASWTTARSAGHRLTARLAQPLASGFIGL